MKVQRLKAGDDLTPAIGLLQRFFREEGFDTPDAVIAGNTRAMASIESCYLLVAEDDGAAVGVATLSAEFGIEFGWSAEMGDLFVDPEWRGKGVARALIGACEDYLKALGAAGYEVTVTPFSEEHHGLRNFYRALGFECEGRVILWKSLPR